MNEREVQHRLYWEYHSSAEILMPNYTPAGWFECDFFRVTKAGYFYEYEIKQSMSDFRADKKKNRYNWKERCHKPKSLMIALAAKGSPSRFYYVVSEKIKDKVISELPDWAGLFEFGSKQDQVFVRLLKQAPKMHGRKISRAIIRHCKTSAMHRYWNEINMRQYTMQSLRDLHHENDKTREQKEGEA